MIGKTYYAGDSFQYYLYEKYNNAIPGPQVGMKMENIFELSCENLVDRLSLFFNIPRKDRV